MRASFIRRRIFWILIILGLATLYPFESTIVPSQNVLVVTDDWRPVQGAGVRQIWQNYSLESQGHEEDLSTDENGRITFPRRTIRASISRRVLHPIWNILRQGVHASFGIHIDMFPLGDVTQKRFGKETVKAQTGDIVFHLE